MGKKNPKTNKRTHTSIKHLRVRDDKHDVHENCPIFRTHHRPCPATSYILPPPWPWTFNFKRTPPLQVIANQLEGNIIQGPLLHVIWPFLQVGFRFQYQLINLVWLSIDFFSFNQSRPQNNFQKLEISFLPSFYNKKMYYGQRWDETLLSAFSWLYFLVCAVVQKYQKMYFLFF